MSHRPGDASPLMARLIEAARAHDEAALAQLKDQTTLDPDRVHELRVTVKRLRALWRLVGTQGPRKLADKQDKRLRAAAASLSGARDLQVMGETLAALHANSRRDYEKEALDRVRELALPEGGDPAVAPEKPADLEKTFLEDRDRWSELKVEGDDDTLIKKGFGRLYANTRRLGFEAVAEDKPDAWHGFRKWVKYQLYQLEPFAGPLENSDIPLKEFKKLGRKLGELHDLHVLDEFLRQARKKTDEKEPFGHVRQLIGRRESALVNECEKRTRGAFSLKPKLFRKALGKALSAEQEA